MIDTHSHIYEPEFDEDRPQVVERARLAGVERILLPNINEESIQPMLSLCHQYPDYCYPMMGLHPEDVKEDYIEVLQRMENLLQAPEHPYIAIGEVGLDFYWDRTYYKEQQDAFRCQIEWALQYHLPLIIHSRAAQEELVTLMHQYDHKGLTGIFHCFGGTLEEARELLAFEGFVLGIGGTVTYKKSRLPEVLQQIPLERIVLETDCPYLAPVPHRGTRNETSYIVEVQRKLSYIYNVDETSVESVTNANVERIFGNLRQC